MGEPPSENKKRERDEAGTPVESKKTLSYGQKHHILLEQLRSKAFSTLEDWFSEYGSDKIAEIEVKLKNCNKATFEYIKRKIGSVQGGSATFVVSESVDTVFVNGIRMTSKDGKDPEFMRKSKLEEMDIDLKFQFSPEEKVKQFIRFNVANEIRYPRYKGVTNTEIIRVKKRYTLKWKDEFLYDLTEVQSGVDIAAARAAPITYEVELEWCGQEKVETYKNQGGIKLITEKFISKVADLLAMKVHCENEENVQRSIEVK